MKKIILLNLWFLVMLLDFFLLTKVINISQLVTNQKKSNNNLYYGYSNNNFSQIYASLPQSLVSYSDHIITADARPEIARVYLSRYNSPLTPHALDIVSISDTYKTDQVPNLWQHVIAIAQCESNLGVKIPQDSFNAWGLGIVTGAKSGLVFHDWPEAIEYEAKFLRKLIDRNLLTPEEWGPIYAPPSVQNGGSWAKCVRHFLDELI